MTNDAEPAFRHLPQAATTVTSRELRLRMRIDTLNDRIEQLEQKLENARQARARAHTATSKARHDRDLWRARALTKQRRPKTP